jgi:hypothetical protein
MDIFSFGMLVYRLFLDGKMSGDGTSVDQTRSTEVLDAIDALKSTPQFLAMVMEQLNSTTTVSAPVKEILKQLFEYTLHHDPKKRASDFAEILRVLEKDSAA